MLRLKTEYEKDLLVFNNNYRDLKNQTSDINCHNKLVEFLDDNFKNGDDEHSHYWLDGKYKIYTVHNAMVSLVLNPMRNNFNTKWKFITEHLNKKVCFEDSVKIMIHKEAERKYNKLVNDVDKLVGEIISVSLTINSFDENIEGFIYGTKNKIRMWSTFVMGEIQCPHFRFYTRIQKK